MSTLKVGCSHCYDVFAETLSPMIWRSQGSTVHNGTGPKGRPEYELERESYYKLAILRASREGRAADAAILTDLLNLLEPGHD